MTLLLIQQVLIMFILAGVGYICFRTKKISMEGCKTLSNILIFLSLPCVIVNSFLVEYSAHAARLHSRYHPRRVDHSPSLKLAPAAITRFRGRQG